MKFLILYKTGPEPTDLEVVAISQGKKAAEGEIAIKENASKGEGEYYAVKFNKPNKVHKKLQLAPTLVEAPEEVEEEES